MKKLLKVWLLGGVSLVFLTPGFAQTTTEPAVATDQQKASASDDQLVNPSGLLVEEIRIQNRLDRVVIQHGENGLSEYYDLRDSSEVYQDGGITERGLMRRWQLGRKR